MPRVYREGNPMRRLVALFIIALFLMVPGCGPVICANATIKPMFSALQDVALQDDAFHGHAVVSTHG
jgi:hypothetical protein